MMKQTHGMLVGFREGVREGTYHGKYLPQIAQGLMWLDNLIGQSQGQLEVAKHQEKEMMKKAKEEILASGGQIKGNGNGPNYPN